MAIEVFNRYEKKYRITQEVYQILRKRLEEFMEADGHSRNGGLYTICNIYYDTPDHDLIRKSVDGALYKEKLRLRSYGTVGPKDPVFLEIKKKYRGLVNKRRTTILLEDACRYLETGEKPERKPFMNPQVLNEIDYMLHRITLEPKLFLSYDRCAMFGKQDKSFRVTFDHHILTRRYDLGLDYGVYGDPLLDEEEWIMEVKIEHAMPLWMTALLSELEVYPASFSKYGTEYKGYVLQAGKEESRLVRSAFPVTKKEAVLCPQG